MNRSVISRILTRQPNETCMLSRTRTEPVPSEAAHTPLKSDRRTYAPQRRKLREAHQRCQQDAQHAARHRRDPGRATSGAQWTV